MVYVRRLRKEYEHEMSATKEGLARDIEWFWDGESAEIHAVVRGPQDSLYEGGEFRFHITPPQDYPFKMPLIKLLTKIYHPDVSDLDNP